LNLEFKSILTKGEIRRAEPHPFEADDEHLADLHRLAFHFNRRDFGRLRQLIDVLNEELEGPADSSDGEEE
ncbi:MAG: cytochrome D ubiquinol oxidase subunit II, partial [Planctomycetaceae bacterium]|nr:cytochrome D ubiquinol oxidase subunit II [Planctomycetaceae bacterium]